MSERIIVQKWLDALEEEGKSVSTCKNYARGLRHFIRWFEKIGGEPFVPADVISRDVRDWIAYQQTVEKARPTTINQRLAALHKFFFWCLREGFIRSDPTTDTHGLRPPQPAPKALSDHEVRRLLRAVHRKGNLRDIAIIEVLLSTGLRVSELLNLQVGDVEIRPRSGKITVRRGKHGQYREVPLASEARRALAAYLDTHPRRESYDAPLWWGQQGPLRSRSGIWQMLHKYAQEAQVEGVGPHVLRHTFATRYLRENPGDLVGLAYLLGHARLETVMIYTRPTLEELAERVERMDSPRMEA